MPHEKTLAAHVVGVVANGGENQRTLRRMGGVVVEQPQQQRQIARFLSAGPGRDIEAASL